MRRTLLLLLSSLGAYAAATTYPMTLHKVVDDQGIHGVAYQYLAPKGWTVKTQLNWVPQIMQPTVFIASADSPDGRFGYSIVPGIDFSFNGVTDSQQFYGLQKGFKNGTEPPQRLSDFMVSLAQKDPTISNIQVTGRKDRPLTPAELGPMRNFGMESQVEFTFTKNGRAMTQVMAARMDGNLVGNVQMQGQAYNGEWQIVNALAVYGPKGEEKKAMKFFSLGAPTYTPTKPFLVARGGFILALNHQIQENIQSIGEISRIRAKLNRQQEDAIMGRYRADQGRKDKFQQQFCDYIGDVRRSRNLDGSELQTNSNDGPPWADGRGGYAFGDNPGPGWTRLKSTGE